MAVETSNSLYTWILCDDDFSYCGDFIEELNLKI